MDDELNLMTVLGLEMTLGEYQREFLNGHTPYFETAALQFSCTECGQCCERPGLVYLTREDIARIAEFFSMTVEEVKVSMLEKSGSDWVLQVDAEVDCLFYRDNKCRIHQVKPSQCRTYPFWPELVGERGAWRAERRYCPGIGQGKRYSAQEVKAMLVGVHGTLGPNQGPDGLS